MKKNLFLIFLSLFVLVTVNAQQQTMVNLHHVNGEAEKYPFADNPKITFGSGKINFVTSKTSKQFSPSEINRMTFSTENVAVLVTGVSLNKTTASLEEGSTLSLSATISPSNATNKTLTWTSSNTAVATVDNGVVTAKKAGTATITATAADGSGVTATCEVTVTAKQEEEPSGDLEPSTDMSAYPNAVYLEDVENRAGDFNLNLKMKNEEENITAFQCDVYLPEGVTWKYTTDKRGKIVYDLPTFNEDRTDDSYHTITPIAKNADGSYNIIVYSNELEVILENDGTLMTLPLEISEEMEAGDYNIFLKNIVLSTPDQQQTLIDKLVSKLTIPSYTIGDANGDGLINVTDIVTVIAHIRGAEPANFIQAAADINEDNLINVTDIVGIIAIIRNASNPTAAKSLGTSLMAKAIKSTTASSNLEVIPFTVAEGTTSGTVQLDMNNPNDEFTAFQCDVVFPEGISWASTIDKRGKKKITQPTFNSDADRTDATYHTVDVGENADGSMNVMVYSTDLEVILDETGAVLDMPFVYDANLAPGIYDITIKNMVLTRVNQTDVKPADYTFSVMVGSPKDSSIKLQGNFTDEAIKDFNKALAGNTNVTSIDMSAATGLAEDVTIASGNKNTLVYAKEGASIENKENVIVGNVCQSLVLTDGDSFSAPKAFTATNATYERTISGTWGTIMLPYEVKSNDDVEYYIPTAVENDMLVLEKQETLAANTPALVAKINGEKIQAAAQNVTINALAGTSANGTVTMYGTYENNTKIDNPDAYYIKNNQFLRCNDYFFIDAFRAYFTVSGTNAKALSIPGIGETTSIEALLKDDNAKGISYYDESGKQINGLKSGVNIIRLSNGQTIKVKR